MDNIVILDYGLGNLASVKNMMRKAGGFSQISSDPEVIMAADKIVLPGVGHFAEGMKNIRKLGLNKVLDEVVLKRKVPVLGICLGMQLMARFSEEGNVAGLGWIDADIVRFRQDITSSLKVPHMGWNEINLIRPHPLFPAPLLKDRFYFVHSFHMRCENEQDILATTNYGYEFICAVSRDNIIGVQFHPEKSHRYGMQMFKHFLNWKR